MADINDAPRDGTAIAVRHRVTGEVFRKVSWCGHHEKFPWRADNSEAAPGPNWRRWSLIADGPHLEWLTDG